ncbi:Putative ribonuclease H protein At1g65750, partial [Linum perenne]
TRKKIHWTKASILTKPKKDGGLGFKNFRLFNLALLAKQGWRIINNPDHLWVRMLKGLYFKDTDFLNAKKGKRASWIWASLCDAREVLSLGARRNIMDGASTRAFHDPWIPTLPNFKLDPNRGSATMVSEWIQVETREWKRHILEEECIDAEIAEIVKIPIGPIGENDQWTWHFDNRGRNTVRSGYHAIRVVSTNREIDRFEHVDTANWNWLWRLKIPPKFIFFVWRASRNALATTRNLWIRQCAPNPKCPICHREEEDVIHCLFKCPIVADVWSGLGTRFHCPSARITVVEWLASCNIGTQNRDALKKISITWNIWKARNEKVFKDKNITVEAISHLALRMYEEWVTPIPTPSPPPSTSMPSSLPNVSAHLKIFCDGSFDISSSTVGYGVIMYNLHEQVIDGKAGRLTCSSALAAEAKALLEAIRMAANNPTSSIIFSDCQILVNALNGSKDSWPWQCFAWLLQMERILLAHDRISLDFTPRTLNKVADGIAGAARRDTLPHDWISNVNTFNFVQG